MLQPKESAKGTSNQGWWQEVSRERGCLALSLISGLKKPYPSREEVKRGRGFSSKRGRMLKSSKTNADGVFGGCKVLGCGWSRGACRTWGAEGR